MPDLTILDIQRIGTTDEYLNPFLYLTLVAAPRTGYKGKQTLIMHNTLCKQHKMVIMKRNELKKCKYLKNFMKRGLTNIR